MNKKIDYLFETYHITPSTDLDQHFFTDFTIAQKIISYAKLSRKDTVLEIGSGLGFLTKQLAKKAGRVIAIEKDTQFEEVLHDELKNYEHVEIIFANALDYLPKEANKIVSNLPYNLCEPLLHKLKIHPFEIAVLMMPKKFAYRMTSTGPIGRISRKWVVELLDDIPKDAFYPQPKINSKIVRLTKKQEIPLALQQRSRSSV
ncbi:hypothetical protein COT72_05380 [archaeon CG10_big_fil_rev_8_21_14_0_10_43_11]|nr:MAG: hypothetical protein COT72_05380 [archaeon CG10_big_fil_rev_8_21_14_0_10_43_11]